MSTESNGLIPLIEEHIQPPVTSGAEIGVFRGRTAAALLRHFPRLRLIMVDTWAPAKTGSSYATSGDGKLKFNTAQAWEVHYQQALAVTDFASSRRHICRMDLVAATKFTDFGLDFVFLDADHSYEGTKRALEAWTPRVQDGGLIAGHDYRDEYPGVIQAVDEAVAARGAALLQSTGTVWGWIT